MRYSLQTLQVLVGVGPPAIGLVWFGWRPILLVAIAVALIWLWVAASLALARYLAGLLCSVMRQPSRSTAIRGVTRWLLAWTALISWRPFWRIVF